jgi:hypothetical protein
MRPLGRVWFADATHSSGPDTLYILGAVGDLIKSVRVSTSIHLSNASLLIKLRSTRLDNIRDPNRSFGLFDGGLPVLDLPVGVSGIGACIHRCATCVETMETPTFDGWRLLVHGRRLLHPRKVDCKPLFTTVWVYEE